LTDLEQMVFMDMRKRELLEARFVNEKVSLLVCIDVVCFQMA